MTCPVAEAQRPRARLRHALERLHDDVVVRADVLRLARRNARAVLEERRRLLERRDVRRVAPALVDERRVGCGEHDGGVDVDVLEVAAAGLAAGDDALDGLACPRSFASGELKGWRPSGYHLGP